MSGFRSPANRLCERHGGDAFSARTYSVGGLHEHLSRLREPGLRGPAVLRAVRDRARPGREPHRDRAPPAGPEAGLAVAAEGQLDAPVDPRVRSPGPPGERFAPGTVLGERYRIVGLLGRGGMGEVYRADDLKLEQPVALKFLPRALEGDPERLERLYGEVRMARQVSHPAVCRVWDVGEAEGQHFLSMEFVDGENLASLLRRIGRLPQDKALDIARQVAPGSPPRTRRASCTATSSPRT